MERDRVRHFRQHSKYNFSKVENLQLSNCREQLSILPERFTHMLTGRTNIIDYVIKQILSMGYLKLCTTFQ